MKRLSRMLLFMTTLFLTPRTVTVVDDDKTTQHCFLYISLSRSLSAAPSHTDGWLVLLRSSSLFHWFVTVTEHWHGVIGQCPQTFPVILWLHDYEERYQGEFDQFQSLGGNFSLRKVPGKSFPKSRHEFSFKSCCNPKRDWNGAWRGQRWTGGLWQGSGSPWSVWTIPEEDLFLAFVCLRRRRLGCCGLCLHRYLGMT